VITRIMASLNQPPVAKVYEALSAVGDGRVKLTGDTSAQVVSSGGDKTYTVKWSPDGGEITSDDNATRWQGTWLPYYRGAFAHW